jgi:hypothetical protein
MEMLRNGADVNREKKRSICDNENVSMEIDSEAQDDITHDVTGNDNGRSAFEYMLKWCLSTIIGLVNTCTAR